MNPVSLTDRLIRQATALGADDAGVCLASDLLAGPSHREGPRPKGLLDHHRLLVLALRHPQDEPALDYFVRKEGARYGNSEGNRRLMRISAGIGQWLSDAGIPSADLHYYVERGGVFLKGAAVLAGLGTVGVNNLFIHPRFGARIRLRAHLVDAPLIPSVPADFDPCPGCHRPCLAVCPEDALGNGGYDPDRCYIRIDRDASESIPLPVEGDGPARREARFCRLCEFACVYGGDGEA